LGLLETRNEKQETLAKASVIARSVDISERRSNLIIVWTHIGRWALDSGHRPAGEVRRGWVSVTWVLGPGTKTPGTDLASLGYPTLSSILLWICTYITTANPNINRNYLCEIFLSGNLRFDVKAFGTEPNIFWATLCVAGSG